MDIVKAIQNKLGDNVSVEKIDQKKNNGVKLPAFLIREQDANIGTIIVYNPDDTDEQIVEKVCEIYHESHENPEYDASDVINAHFIYSNVYPAVINRTKNEAELADLVHTPLCGDLEVIYKIEVETPNFGKGFMTLSKVIFDAAGLTLTEVQGWANKNVYDRYMTFDMSEAMSVITTTVGMYGAGIVASPDALRRASEELGMENMYVIPSSVHEVILVPADTTGIKHYLIDMIRAANENVVEPQDFLSNMLFKYSRSTERLEVA